MKRLLFLGLIVILAFPGLSQKKQLSISDAIIGQFRHLYPSYYRNLQWQADTDQFTYIKGNAVVQQSVSTDKEKELFTLDQLNAGIGNIDQDSLKYIPSFSWKDDATISFKIKSLEVFYHLDTKKFTKGKVSPSGANLTKSSADDYAFTKDHNLFVIKNNGDTIQLSTDGKEGIVYGESVHRNEFGIKGGLFWSPKGNKLAFYRMDETMVSMYPLVDVTTRIAEIKNIRYPMAGMASHHVTLGVYDKESGKITYIKTGEPVEQYLTCITWSPDEKNVFIGLLNRGQNHLKMNKYDAESGELVKTLFQEKHEKYVEPEHSLYFLEGRDDQFIWQSERSGYNHLYLYNTEGKVIMQLTKGDWEVTNIQAFHKEKAHLYLEATKESPLERHIYRLDMGSLKLTRITQEAGTHRGRLSSNFNYMLDDFNSVEVPQVYNLVSTNGELIRELKRSADPMAGYTVGEMNLFTIKAADGITDLHCRIIKPVDFKPKKKYPAIIYVYGGPHAQMVTNTWLGGARLWNYYMAQKGYVMLTVDNRGSAHRGLEFENVIHRNIGEVEMADQMKGVEYLETLGYVDMDRIGVHGWSYGGFMTTSLMTNYPEVFKVGAAGGPVIDWSYYEIMYGERYMDTPEENEEGYEKASLIPDAKKLKGKLLMVHGAQDPVVVWQHSQAFMNECIKNNVQLDYFIYPNHEHNVRGYDRIHLMDKVSIYFDDYLKDAGYSKKKKKRSKK
jgi:dipeptidyl-peptidase 4